MIIALTSQFHVYLLWVNLSYCLNSVLYVKVLIGVFNHDQEKALVGAFSVIVKTNCETDGSFAALVMIATYPMWRVLLQRHPG